MHHVKDETNSLSMDETPSHCTAVRDETHSQCTAVKDENHTFSMHCCKGAYSRVILYAML